MSHHFTLLNSQTVDLTLDLAVEFSKMPATVSERDLKQRRLDYLKDRVLDGTAITFHWARAKVADSGEIYRVNGHHSANMLAGLNGQFPVGLKAHIDDYEVQHKGLLALLFRQFDSRVSARTIEDISGVYQGLHPALIEVPKATARTALEGAIWYMTQIEGLKVPSGDDRFTLFDNVSLHPFIQMAGRIHTVKTPEFTLPVIGAMYGTFEREPSWAETFWTAVAKGGGENPPGHPTTTLDAWLIEALECNGDRPTKQAVYIACALAWNANRHGRNLEKITATALKKGSLDLD
jgi:hypothetical protein